MPLLNALRRILRLAWLPVLTMLTVMPACAATAAVPVTHYDCNGQLRSENLFDGGTPDLRDVSIRISINPVAEYVKRPPVLASGCLEKQVEFCGCQQSPELIRCRSLGIAPDGTEIAMDFSLDRIAQRLQVNGRRQQPKSGEVTETSGLLVCHAAESP